MYELLIIAGDLAQAGFPPVVTEDIRYARDVPDARGRLIERLDAIDRRWAAGLEVDENLATDVNLALDRIDREFPQYRYV
jgi:hypothetical protein